MQDIKSCPLCGEPVDFREEIKFIPPEQNIEQDAWRCKSRVKITCDKCCLSMDVGVFGNYRTRMDGFDRHAELIKEVVAMWNRRA